MPLVPWATSLDFFREGFFTSSTIVSFFFIRMFKFFVTYILECLDFSLLTYSKSRDGLVEVLEACFLVSLKDFSRVSFGSSTSSRVESCDFKEWADSSSPDSYSFL